MPVTLEKTAEGLIRSLLFGKGRQALLSRLGKQTFQTFEGKVLNKTPIVAENGAALLGQRPFFGQSAGNKVLSIKDLLLGRQPLDVLSQRMRQGGIAGKGGLLHGSVAMPEPMYSTWKNEGPLKAIGQHPVDAMGHAVNLAWMGGIPAYTVYHHAKNRNLPGATGAVGETLGWSLGAPFGLIGGPMVANKMRQMATKQFVPELPEINLGNESYLNPPDPRFNT